MKSPYTYYLYHIPTQKKYYGVQYGPKSNPDNLWTTYFSSSKKVHELIEQYGKDSFFFEIRKLFKTPEEAFSWEQRVLQKLKVVGKDEWLNQALARGPYLSWGKRSRKTRLKISLALTGKKRGCISEETRLKMSIAAKKRGYNRTDYKPTEETKKKMSLSQKGKTNVGKIQTPEHRKKNSEAVSAWWKKRKENSLALL